MTAACCAAIMILHQVLHRPRGMKVVTTSTCGIASLPCVLMACSCGLSLPLLLLATQAIFKQLLSLKWAERNLGQLWQCMRSTKRLSR